MLRGVTFRTGSRVALVVGTVLTLVNQGSVIFGGDASVVTWIRVAVNYLVPFVVASLSLIHISEPTRPRLVSRMPSSA